MAVCANVLTECLVFAMLLVVPVTECAVHSMATVEQLDPPSRYWQCSPMPNGLIIDSPATLRHASIRDQASQLGLIGRPLLLA
jgi:hypothetical protein